MYNSTVRGVKPFNCCVALSLFLNQINHNFLFPMNSSAWTGNYRSMGGTLRLFYLLFFSRFSNRLPRRWRPLHVADSIAAVAELAVGADRFPACAPPLSLRWRIRRSYSIWTILWWPPTAVAAATATTCYRRPSFPFTHPSRKNRNSIMMITGEHATSKLIYLTYLPANHFLKNQWTDLP